ncbi:uncharacterized protein [Oscarella lobularis]|uniref:uncharacterized protein isoform X2 n=1 Tax=Oscarella lobularis TaxID=121494 RepID=UPI003314043C
MATPPVSAVSRSVPPSCYIEFSDEWEATLMALDDKATQLAQQFTSPILRLFHAILLVVTSIELGVIASYALLYLGLNNIATLVIAMTSTLVVVSQLSKRFVWRDRPHMVGRAKRIGAVDSTSSFPSRAVTSGIVYLYTLAGCFELAWSEGKDNLAKFDVFWTLPFLSLTVLETINTSFFRIHVGAHYISDCLGGILQGICVCYVGQSVYYIFANECCMAALLTSKERALLLVDISWMPIACWTIAGALFMTVVSLPQFQFWSKSHYVLGLLYPCLMTVFTFLCCDTHNFPLVSHLAVLPGSVCIAIIIPTVLILIGRYLLPHSSLIKSVASFLFLHSVSAGLLIFHRAA